MGAVLGKVGEKQLKVAHPARTKLTVLGTSGKLDGTGANQSVVNNSNKVLSKAKPKAQLSWADVARPKQE